MNKSTAAWLVCALMLVSCKSRKKDVVAIVGGSEITAQEFQERMQEIAPYLRTQYASFDRKKDLLDTMVRNELLYQEAKRRGLESAPAVREQLKRAMVQELMRQQGDASGQTKPPSDGDLQRYYDEHRGEFVNPERIQAAHLLVSTDKRDRAAARKEAERLLSEIRSAVQLGKATAFEDLARTLSDDLPSRPFGGNMGALSLQDMTSRYGEVVGKAAFALATPGDIAGPIDTPRGFELVKLEARFPGVDRSFASVKQMLRGRMVRDDQTRAYDDFVKQLRGQIDVRVDEARLSKIDVPPETANSLHK